MDARHVRSSDRSILSRYAFAVLVTVAAVLVRHSLSPLIGTGTTFLVAFPAAMLSALYGGLGPGLLSGAISMAGAAAVLYPGNGGLLTAPVFTRFAIFAASCAMIAVLCEWLHRAQRRGFAYAHEHARAREDLQSSKRDLEAAHDRLENILASVSDAYYTVDREWRFTHLNALAERHFGRPKSDLLGQVVWDVVPDARGSEFERRYRLAMETGTPQHLEAISPLTHRWVEVHTYPFEGGLSVFFRDVTERKQMEQALSERETEFRTIFELAAAGKAQADPATSRFTRVNRRLCEITGYDESELLGMSPFDLTYPDDVEAERQIVEPVYRGERDAWESEKRYLRKDGGIAWVYVNGRLLRSPDGRPLRTIATIIDISQRKRAERALREREDQIRLIANAVPALISYVDTDCRYRWTNETYRRWFRTDPSGRHVRDVVGDDAWESVRPYMERAQRGEDVAYEHELNYDVIGPRWVNVTYTPDRDPAGQVRGIVVLVNDITAAKRAEQALRESESRFRNMADNAPVMIWLTDPGGDCTYVNKQWLDFTGQTQEQGCGCGWLDAVHPEERGWVEELFLRANARREPFRAEFHLRRHDGEYRWCIDSASPRFDPDGNYLGYVGSVMDIADRRRTEQELRDATAAAEQANRAKDQFLAVLSHELRTPLTPVLTASQMLESGAAAAAARSPAELKELASVIRRNVELEARLIDDLLDLTRVSRGKLLLTIEPVDAHEKVREVVRAVSTDAEAHEVRIRLKLEAVNHHVRGDHARFQQVLSNLLRNAIKFSHAGGEVTIRTCNGAGAAADTLTLEVIDQGVGIEPHVLPRLFNAFEQGGRDMTRQFGGLGLGLAISKALVDAQGGTIAARSEGRDRGATFTVTMPVAEPVPATGTGDGRGQQAAGRGHRILLVEDHEDTSRLMAALLRGSGYAVKTAATVADALRTAEAEAFDAVISDLGLPDGTGNDLMQQLTAKYNLRGLAVSGYGMEEDIRRAKQSGFVEHLTKPVNANQFLATLDRLLAG